ncbi:MAG: hypothetical protein ACLSE8_09315 [Parasutterella sp.]
MTRSQTPDKLMSEASKLTTLSMFRRQAAFPVLQDGSANSTVELTGGTIEHAVLGSGNTYNLGSGSGSNDAATFTVGTLDSSSVVNINRGATLRTENSCNDWS